PNVILPAPVIVKVRPVAAASEMLTVPNVVPAELLTVKVRLAPEFVKLPLNVNALVPAIVLLAVIVTVFGATIAPPLTLESVPPPSVTVPVEGNAPVLPRANVPAEIVVPPVYEFAALNRSVPVPFFVRRAAPLLLLRVPDISAESPPVPVLTVT